MPGPSPVILRGDPADPHGILRSAPIGREAALTTRGFAQDDEMEAHECLFTPSSPRLPRACFTMSDAGTSYAGQLCRRVSMIWMIFHPSGVRKNWRAFTPQWLKRSPRWKR